MVARLVVSFKTHNLVCECKRKMILTMMMIALPEEMDDLGDLKNSQEWVVTSLVLESQMFHISTSVPALVPPQAWPSDLVMYMIWQTLLDELTSSLVWSPVSLKKQIEGRFKRLSQRAQQQPSWSWLFMISVLACLPDFVDAEFVNSAGEPCRIMVTLNN